MIGTARENLIDKVKADLFPLYFFGTMSKSILYPMILIVSLSFCKVITGVANFVRTQFLYSLTLRV